MSGLQDILNQEKSSIEDSKTINDFDYVERKYAKPKKEEQQSIQPKAEVQDTNTEKEDTSSVIDYAKEQLAHPIDNMALPLVTNVGVGGLQAISGVAETVAHPYDLLKNVSGVALSVPKLFGEAASVLGFDTVNNFFNHLDEMNKIEYENNYGNYQNNAVQNVIEAFGDTASEYGNEASKAINSIKSQEKAKATVDGVAGFISDLENLIPQVVGQLGGSLAIGGGAQSLVGKAVANSKSLTAIENSMIKVTEKISNKLASKLPKSIADKVALNTAGNLLSRTSGYMGQMATYLGMSQDELKNTFEDSYNNLTSSQIETSEMFKYLQDKYKAQYPNATDEDIYNKSIERFKSIYLDMCNSQLASNGLSIVFDTYGDKLALSSLLKGSIVKNALGEGIAEGGQNLFAQKTVVDVKNRLGIANDGIDMKQVGYNAGLGAGVGAVLGAVGNLNKSNEQPVVQPTNQSTEQPIVQDNKSYPIENYFENNNADQQNDISSIRLVEDVNKDNVDENGRRIKPSQRKTKDIANVETGIDFVNNTEQGEQYNKDGYDPNKDVEDIGNVAEDIKQEETNKWREPERTEDDLPKHNKLDEGIKKDDFNSVEKVFDNAIDNVSPDSITPRTQKVIELYRKDKTKFLERYKGILQQQINDLEKTPLDENNKKEVTDKIENLKKIISSNESLDGYVKSKIIDTVMTDNVNAYNNVSKTDVDFENKRAKLRNEFDNLQYGLNAIRQNSNSKEQTLDTSGYNVSFDEKLNQTKEVTKPEPRSVNINETPVDKVETSTKENNQSFDDYVNSIDRSNLTDKTSKQLEDYTQDKKGYIKKYLSNVKRKITNLTKKDKLSKAEQKELSKLNRLTKLNNTKLGSHIEKELTKQIDNDIKTYQNNTKNVNDVSNNVEQENIKPNNDIENKDNVAETQEENKVNEQVEQPSNISTGTEDLVNPTEIEDTNKSQANQENLTKEQEEEPKTLSEWEEYFKNNGKFHKQIEIEKEDYIKADQFNDFQKLHKEMVSKAKELFNVKKESELPDAVKVQLDRVKDNITDFKGANKNIITNSIKTNTNLYNSIIHRELTDKLNRENRQGIQNNKATQTKQNAEIKKLNIQTENKTKANEKLDKDIEATAPQKLTPAEKGKVTKVLNMALSVLDPFLDGNTFNIDSVLNSTTNEKAKAGYQSSLTKLSKAFNELSNYINNNKEYDKRHITELVKDINDNIERYNKYRKEDLGEAKFKRVTSKNSARSNDSVIYTEQQTSNKPLDKHIQEKEVKEFLENYIKDKPILRNVEVVLLNNDQDVVNSLNDIGIKLEDGSVVAGYFDAVANKVYLNSSRIANTTELKQTLFHEIVGHYGFNKVLTQQQRDEFNNLMDQVVNEEQLNDLAELYGNDKFLLHEELLADYIANRETQGTLGKAWNKVKNFIDNILSKWFGKNTTHNVLESAYQSIVNGMSSGLVNDNLHNSIARDTSIKYKRLANKIISNPKYNFFLPFRSDTEFYEQFKDNEYAEPIINIYTKTKEAFTVIRHRLQNKYGKVVALNRKLLQEVTDSYNKAHPKDKKHITFFERQLGKFQNDMTIARFNIEDIETFLSLNESNRRQNRRQITPDTFVIGTPVYNHLQNVLNDPSVNQTEKEKAQKEFDDLGNKFADLVNQYNQLDAKQIQLYKENRDLYATQMNDVIDAYKEFVRQSGGTNQSNPVDPNDPNSKTKLEQIIEDLESIVDNQIGDYFPLARFGKYKLDYVNKNGERVVKMFTSKTVAKTSIDLIKKSGDYSSIKELELEKLDDVKTFENTIDLNELDAEISRINEVNGMISKDELEKRLRDFVLNKVSDTSAEQFLLRERDRVLGADESLIMTMQNRANTIANFASTLRVQNQRNLNAIDRRWQENALEVITKIKQKDALDVLRTWADNDFSMTALNSNERKIFDTINSENKLQRMYPDKYIDLIDEQPDRSVYETVRRVNREISLREEMLAKMRNEKPLNEVLGITSAINYAITLGGNLSSAALNLSQIMLLTLPHVTGKCGYVNTIKGLSKMMKNYYYVYNSSRAWKDVPKEIWRTGSEKPVVSITRTLRDLGNKRTPEQEKNYRILQHLTEHDIIGSNLVNELNIRKNRVDDLVGNITVGLKNKLGLIESENDIAKTKSRGIINGLNNMISSAFSICDALSKEGSALLSYYAYESANPKATEDEKIDYMMNSVKQTQFEYRKSMKGWGMNIPYIQPFMTFATYPVGMMSFYLNNWGHLLQGLKSGNTEQRNEATKKLMTFTVMGLVTGGLSSTGLDTLFLFLLGLLQDDDDPDYMGLANGKLSMGQILKGEKAMKEWGHIGKILDKGLLSYLTGIDFSSRLQFEPIIKANIRKLAHENNIWEALGKSLIMPSINKGIPNLGSFVADMFDDVTAGNIDKMGDDVLKFMRTALFIDNVYKAIEISKSGKTYGNKNMKLQPEDYSTYEAFMQMFGFRSLQLSNLYDETQLARKQSMGVSAQEKTEEWNIAKHKKQQENRIKELQELREQSKGKSVTNVKPSNNKPKRDTQKPFTNKQRPMPNKTNNRPRKENIRPKR